MALYRVSDLYPGIQDLLMGRVVAESKMAEYIRKVALEFSESYDCYELQITQPPIQLEQYVNSYSGSFFFPNPSDLPYLDPSYINKFKSIFLFTDPYVTPSSSSFSGANSGYNLTYRSIDRLNVLLNTAGLPIHWSRYSGQVWFAPIPDKSYWIEVRYQREHLFPNAGTPTEGDDYLFFANSWKDVLEHAAAQRLAAIYNLSTKATELNQRLLGDSKFQTTNGIEGQPGLIFQRTSQEQRDQLTTVRSFRLKMGRG